MRAITPSLTAQIYRNSFDTEGEIIILKKGSISIYTIKTANFYTAHK